MNEHYPPLLTDASADDVLRVLRDLHRLRCSYDIEANPKFWVTHDSTVAQWQDEWDLYHWSSIARGLNRFWSVEIPMADWRRVLVPAETRRLRDVCELLARHAKIPHVRPATILGSTCVTAGAFLTVRSYLADAGADVTNLAPSTPLHEYTRRHAHVFIGPIARLAPGALPRVKVRAPVHLALAIGLLVSPVVIAVALFHGHLGVGLLFVLMFVLCYAGGFGAGRWVFPTSVEFRGLVTFRDLSMAIAAGAD